jgi:hypothetical protein
LGEKEEETERNKPLNQFEEIGSDSTGFGAEIGARVWRLGAAAAGG